jgi:signal transduction histidine kinase
LARAYCALGIYFGYIGDGKKALAYYDTALVHAGKISDPIVVGRIYNGLGNIFANFGDFEKALNYHFRSLKIKERQNDQEGIGYSYNNIGNIYYRLGNYNKALDYLFESLEIRKRLDNRIGIAASKNNIALAYNKQGKRGESMNYFLEALNEFRALKVHRGITYSCHDIAEALMEQKKYDQALPYLKEGLAAAESMKSIERITDFKVSFAHYYNAIGHYEQAQENAQEAVNIALSVNLLDYARLGYKELSEAFYSMKKFKEAFYFLKSFNLLNDSILNEKKIEKALEVEFNFKEEKSRFEQEKRALIYENTVAKQRWLIYVSISSLIGVMAVAFLIYRNSKMRIRSSDLLTAQKNELAAKNKLILEQNELLNEAKNQLEQGIEERTADLKMANKELVNQNLVMEQFSFMTAHNLRGPVARLVGLTSLYNYENQSDPFNMEVIKRIHQSAADLDEVIHDLTSILQIRSGIQDPIVSLDLKETLDKILYQFQDVIKEKNISIINQLDQHLIVDGILAYVQSVFYNVISNSIKYYDNQRPPEIKISYTKSSDQIEIVIADNGIGFNSESNREKMFRPFTRFSTTREGKGLGLYLIKIQMESIKGHVDIESKLNVGTTVKLLFPMNASHAKADQGSKVEMGVA